MRYTVSDTMRFKLVFLLLFFFAGVTPGQGQENQERAYRIRKSQFPASALDRASSFLDEAKRVRYYREIDSSGKNFEIKFKKDRLYYSARFNKEGKLQAVEVGISPVDVPGASWEAIEGHLANGFGKYRIVRIGQQYPRAAFTSDSETFRNAFQNLLLPEIRYEVTLRSWTGSGQKTWEAVYSPTGLFLSLREAPPANYAHILY